jgi:hypothetical protein
LHAISCTSSWVELEKANVSVYGRPHPQKGDL